jgi:hypothetical protein
MEFDDSLLEYFGGIRRYIGLPPTMATMAEPEPSRVAGVSVGAAVHGTRNLLAAYAACVDVRHRAELRQMADTRELIGRSIQRAERPDTAADHAPVRQIERIDAPERFCSSGAELPSGWFGGWAEVIGLLISSPVVVWRKLHADCGPYRSSAGDLLARQRPTARLMR